MVTEYSKTGSTVRPFKLTDDLLTEMGRLLRACTEMEDIVGLHLCQIARISEAQSLILLGRMNLSEKIRLATVFATALGGEAKNAHNLCFGDDTVFKDIIRCRNTIAHGLLLGLTEQGKLAFRTVEVVGADETSASVNVISYAPGDFAKFAEVAELSIPQLEGILKLGPLREIRRKRGLLPHRKAQPTRPPSAKHMRQRKSSLKSAKPRKGG